MTKDELKAKFADGQRPTGQDYSDFIDETFNEPIEGLRHENPNGTIASVEISDYKVDIKSGDDPTSGLGEVNIEAGDVIKFKTTDPNGTGVDIEEFNFKGAVSRGDTDFRRLIGPINALEEGGTVCSIGGEFDEGVQQFFPLPFDYICGKNFVDENGNPIGGVSYKPGDIIKVTKGRSVDIEGFHLMDNSYVNYDGSIKLPNAYKKDNEVNSISISNVSNQIIFDSVILTSGERAGHTLISVSTATSTPVGGSIIDLTTKEVLSVSVNKPYWVFENGDFLNGTGIGNLIIKNIYDSSINTIISLTGDQAQMCYKLENENLYYISEGYIFISINKGVTFGQIDVTSGSPVMLFNQDNKLYSYYYNNYTNYIFELDFPYSTEYFQRSAFVNSYDTGVLPYNTYNRSYKHFNGNPLRFASVTYLSINSSYSSQTIGSVIELTPNDNQYFSKRNLAINYPTSNSNIIVTSNDSNFVIFNFNIPNSVNVMFSKRNGYIQLESNYSYIAGDYYVETSSGAISSINIKKLQPYLPKCEDVNFDEYIYLPDATKIS